MAETRRLSLAGRLLRLVSRVVPRPDRRRWLQEWEAELWQLENAVDPSAAPSPLSLTLGAVPHSLWERKEWTLGVLLQDARFAVRVLLRSPLFTTLAVVTVALGVGANTMIFTMTNATLLRAPAAIDDPETVVQIGRDRVEEGFDNLAYPYLVDFQESSEGLDSVAAHTSLVTVLGRGETAQLTSTQLVTGEYFRLLGIDARPGRVLTPDDDRETGGHPVAVISDGLWTRRFARDPAIVGAPVRINGSDYQVIGVAERGFQGTDVASAPTDLWIPMSMSGVALGPRYEDIDDRGFSWLWIIGRLGEGQSAAAVQAELDAIYTQRYEAQWGEPPGSPIGVLAGVGLRPDERQQIRQLMTLLSLVVAMVLAVACANLANLLLARGIARSQELGVRMALGAGRVRLVRQLLTESLLLALAGGALALLLTQWASRLIPSLLPVRLGVGFAPDLSVMGFALAISLGTGLLFGLAPAARVSRRDLVETIKDGSPLGGRGGAWLRNGLVVAQLALSFTLLAGTGLLVQSLIRATAADPGYSTRDVATITIDATISGYDAPEALALYRQIRQRAGTVAGVEAAALGSNLPFSGWSRRSVFYPEPRPELERPFVQIDWTSVTPGLLAALEIPLVAGEALSDATAGADMQRVALISESGARLLFGEEDPIDRLVPLTEERSPEQSLRIVGVVGDVQMRSLQEAPRAAMYVPVEQNFSGRMTLFARGGSPDATLRPLREAVLAIDPDLAIMAQGSLQDRMGSSLRDTLTVARLAGVFGGLAFVLAAVGLYGVVAYIASTRTREVGVRMALGARTGDVMSLFLGQAVRITALGVAVGAALTFAGGSLLANLLYGVRPSDPTTLVVIAVAVLLVSLAAAGIPARRATRVNPVRALRQD